MGKNSFIIEDRREFLFIKYNAVSVQCAMTDFFMRPESVPGFKGDIMHRVEEKKKVSSPTSAPREIADLKISDAINRSSIAARYPSLFPAMTRVNLSLNDFFNPRASVHSV